MYKRQDGRLFVTKMCWQIVNAQTYKDYTLGLVDGFSLKNLSVDERATIATSDFLDLSFSEACEVLGWDHKKFIEVVAAARQKVLS